MRKKLICTVAAAVMMGATAVSAYAQTFSETLENFCYTTDKIITWDLYAPGSAKDRFFDFLSLIPDEQTVVMPFELTGKVEVFVSPDGNDRSGDGSIKKPYKTINKAVNEIKKFDYSTRKKGVILYLRGGDHTVSETIQFDERFSGLKDIPIFISSYNGEEVRVSTSNSIPLADFKHVSDPAIYKRLQENVRDNILEVDLGKYGITDYGTILYDNEYNKTYSKVETKVFSDNDIMTLARYPNGSDTLRLGELLDRGPEPGEPDLGQGHSWTMADDRAFSWEYKDDIGVFAYYSFNYNPERKRVLGFDAERNAVLCAGRRLGAGTPGLFRTTKENTYYFYNVLEELDTEGEWYIDRSTGMMYIYPFSYTDENTTIQLSTGEHDIINIDETKNVVINGITFRNTSGKAISGTDGKYFVIQNCKFISSDVSLTDFRYSGITTSYFSNSKASVSKDRFDSESVQEYWDDRNFIMNCFLEGSQQTDKKLSLSGNNCVMSHNFASDQSHGAFGGGGANFYLEYNEGVGNDKVQGDGGSYYTGDVLASNVHVRYNYIHHHGNRPKFGREIYFDEGGSDFMAYGNIMHDGEYGSFSHNGKMGVYYNNLFLENEKNLATSANYYGQYIKARTRAKYNHESSWYYPYNRYTYDPSKLEWFKRYPEQLEYVNKVGEYQKEIDQNSPEMTPAENWLLSANYFYIANNISLGGKHEIAITTPETSVIENNPFVEKEAFADYDNYDFRIVDEEVLKQVPGWKDIPLEKIGLIKDCDMWRDLTIGQMKRPMFPKSGYENRVSPAQIRFEWQKVSGAAFYRLQIAEDENFENVVYDQETGNLNVNVDLEADKRYYCKVTALSKAKTLDFATSECDVFDFYTMTTDEANAILVANKTEIRLALSEAQSLADKIVEGDNPGEYPVGTKTELNNYITNSRKYMEETNIQAYIDAKETEIRTKMYEAQSKVKLGNVINLSVDASHWSKIEDDNTAGNQEKPVSFTQESDGSLTVGLETNTSAFVTSDELIPYGTFAAIKIKSDSFEQWQVFGGLTSKGISTSLGQMDLYSIILSKDSSNAPSIEMQKYKRDGGLKEFLTFENKGEVKENEWVEMIFGMIPYEGGTRFIAIADGKVLYDYEDSIENGAYFMDSYFVHNKNKLAAVTQFAQSDVTYEEIMEIINNK